MSIFIKINSRISLNSYEENLFVFVVDGCRTAKFYTQMIGLDSIIMDFLNNGMLLNEALHEHLSTEQKNRFIQFMEMLMRNHLIEYHFHFGDSEMAVICPTTPYFKKFSFDVVGLMLKSSPYVLSRFAYFRREYNRIILESSLIPFKIFLNEEFFMQFMPFITGKNNLSEYSSNSSTNNQTVNAYIQFLIEYKVIHPIDEPEADHLRFWEFHDLIFHSNSRQGRFNDNTSFGATYRFLNKRPPPNTFKEIDLDGVIKLYKPNLDSLTSKDIPFSKVLESRRSIRSYSESSMINVKELGEFLYRSLGIREVVNNTPQDGVYRPYPAAGAIHEIEFYLVVNTCESLKPDVYYYNPVQHVLCRKNVDKKYIERLVTSAQTSMGKTSDRPHILFVLTSRFEKIAWKYEKMAYRSTLISMGAIFQTMSLVATSMNLASCIIGAGNPSLFSEILGINSLEEGSIGEFAIGTKCY